MTGAGRPLPPAAALLLFAGSLALFCGFAGERLFHQSAAPHFVYQAAAWLEGHLSIDVLLPNDNDWARATDGSLHVSFPPGPALLLVPLVAIWGYQTGDVFFTCVLAALAIVALAWALGRRAPGLPLGRRWALAALFAIGTVFLPAAVRGEVWFTAHVVGALALCVLAGASAHGVERPWLAGVALGLGAITRTPLALAAALPLLDALLPEGRPVARAALGAALRRLAIVALAAAPFATFALALNAARFGDPLEFGHRLLHANRVLPVLATHGLFSLQYLPRNLEAALLLLPRLQAAWPPLVHDPRGMSLLVTTPPLALLAAAHRWHRGLLPIALPAALLAVPGLLYMNTGWVQFGHRFSLDWLPLGFVLLAQLDWPARASFWALAAPGVVVCVLGGLVF